MKLAQQTAQDAAHLLTFELLDEDLQEYAAGLVSGMTGFDELVKVQELRDNKRIIELLLKR